MYTEQDVREKMEQLGMKGYGALGRFTPDELMGQLTAIESEINKFKSTPPAPPAIRRPVEAKKDEAEKLSNS